MMGRFAGDLMADYPTREDAITLLHTYTKTDSLRLHALGVEQAMRKMAEKYDGDTDEWGITGLMHDFDYENFNVKKIVLGTTILRLENRFNMSFIIIGFLFTLDMIFLIKFRSSSLSNVQRK